VGVVAAAWERKRVEEMSMNEFLDGGFDGVSDDDDEEGGEQDGEASDGDVGSDDSEEEDAGERRAEEEEEDTDGGEELWTERVVSLGYTRVWSVWCMCECVSGMGQAGAEC
jgi:hypothetical protein